MPRPSHDSMSTSLCANVLKFPHSINLAASALHTTVPASSMAAPEMAPLVSLDAEHDRTHFLGQATQSVGQPLSMLDPAAWILRLAASMCKGIVFDLPCERCKLLDSPLSVSWNNLNLTNHVHGYGEKRADESVPNLIVFPSLNRDTGI